MGTIDSLALAYRKGKLTCFLRDPKAIVDTVVNAILVAMVAHAKHPSSDAIYHDSSSTVTRPLRYKNLQDYGFRYFTAKPWINKDGKPVKVSKVTVLSNMDSFRRYMFIRYLLLLKAPICFRTLVASLVFSRGSSRMASMRWPWARTSERMARMAVVVAHVPEGFLADTESSSSRFTRDTRDGITCILGFSGVDEVDNVGANGKGGSNIGGHVTLRDCTVMRVVLL
ncbi:hypothetical protein RJT34_30968 [Clitoria ternatea]|uniref:Fatty acyl-CoA reductase n=1 Tax=Clitoria ternatea TaxID=43366 RepID=A0AAN9I355_CLITE